MAKCPVCDSRKGKRKCVLTGGFVCTQCCGQIRKEETCRECAYYRPAQASRRYGSVPRYTPEQMDFDMQLQSYGFVIEAALCDWDQLYDQKFRDEAALQVLERLLDRYHFGDEEIQDSSGPVRHGFEMVVDSIDGKLQTVPKETVARAAGAIYFVAKRRTRGGREYLNLIRQFTGR